VNQELLRNVKLVAFDFDGVFTDNSVYISQEGIETVRCCRSDGLGLDRLRKVNVQIVIISTEKNSVVSVRASKLKIRCIHGVEDKAAEILKICTEAKIAPVYTMFVGNDINDIPAFKSVGMPVGVNDAYPEIIPHIIFATNNRGGYGAVRELCDMIYHAKLKTEPAQFVTKK
jgi:3-deoxy-D-manno-octulosonate 8-phosphate phosphatase (KDO 8-P phosphatase)